MSNYYRAENEDFGNDTERREKELIKEDEMKKETLGVWDIKFFKEDNEGNRSFVEYDGVGAIICDMIDESKLKEIK